jgi:FtsH-binding integral membrane protein
VLGFAAVILPPMGAFGIVAVAGLVLLWVMPDLPLVSPGFIRKAFFFMVIADLVIPFYYTVQFSGLPWISARRVATVALIAPFVVAVAASSEVRRHIAERARASLLLFICAAGFLAVATLSVFTSISPTESTSALVDAILSWYVPFFAMIYIAKDKNDIIFLLKIICICAIFNTGAGVVEFFLKHRFFIDIFPKSMLATLIESNPTLANLLPNPGDFRNGLFRAASTFVTALSFGEFEISSSQSGYFSFCTERRFLRESLAQPLPSAESLEFSARGREAGSSASSYPLPCLSFSIRFAKRSALKEVWSQQFLVFSALSASAVSLHYLCSPIRRTIWC